MNNSLVENCRFGTGHGASIGSLCDHWLQNITFRNIVFDGTTSGARIKVHEHCAGTVKNVVYENLVMKDVETPIDVNMFYGSPGSLKKTTFTIKGVTFRNITATGSSKTAASFVCDPESPCHSLKLENIDLGTGKMTCQDAYGTSSNVTPKSCIK